LDLQPTLGEGMSGGVGWVRLGVYVAFSGGRRNCFWGHTKGVTGKEKYENKKTGLAGQLNKEAVIVYRRRSHKRKSMNAWTGGERSLATGVRGGRAKNDNNLNEYK